MTTYERHDNAPYADGETLAAADLETDFENARTVINGNIENANIAAAANIAGSKLADDSVANAKLSDDTIALGKMAAASVGKAQIEVATATTNMTTSTTFVDVPDVSSISISPGSTDDIIEMDLTVTGKTTTWGHWAYGFSVGGTDSNRLGVLSMKLGAVEAAHLLSRQTVTITYATSGFSGATVIKPRYHLVAGGGTVGVFADTTQGAMDNRVFRVRVIPIKV